MMHFNDCIMVGDSCISKNSPTFIIGEAGVNHNGDISIAKELVDCAVEAGVDAVKFQLFKTENLILQSTEKAPYQKKTTESKQSQFDMLKSLELKDDSIHIINDYCEKKGIIFLCTPFEKHSLDLLDDMGISAFKVAATDLTNIHFLRQISEKNKPIILSAGMCYMEEVRMALETIYPINRNLILLQCTANYPLNDEEVNLNVIDTFRKEFDVTVGFSDHSVGIGAAPFAVAKGAKVVEKHFTLSRKMSGPDHKASVEPKELSLLVKEIRRVESFLGTGIKTPTISEQYTRNSLQKCIVAAKEIKEGDMITADDLTAKRTGGKGISALYFDTIVGKRATRYYQKDDIIDE